MQSISQTPSIYQIRHIESGKVYVGSAINPRQRKSEHYKCLRKGTHHARHLQNAWNKYGEGAFVFEIIEPVLFIEDLIAREQYWMDTLHASDGEYGYNSSPTAGSNLGFKHTPESRAANGERTKVRAADPAYRAALAARIKEASADPIVRERLSRQSKAYYASPEARALAVERGKKRFADPVERAKLSERAKAQFADPAARARASERTKQQFADPEWKARFDEIMRARNADPAYRAKVKESQRARRLREKQGG